MKLTELKEKVDMATRIQPRPENVEVVISTVLPYATVGQRPCVGVKYVGMGFDWEAGQFRIEPEEKLIIRKNDVPQKILEWEGNYHCPKCEKMLSKSRKKPELRFCSWCGQAVKWE